ncbi:MAG: FAD-binding oxidoreductase, partial [Bacillota bacterium]
MALAAEVVRELKDAFGDRCSTDPLQRLLYGHDQGALPDAIMRVINHQPDAVVQPVDAEELVKLVSLAREHKIPLVPRGSGTSGYGGAIPTRGGIVVDFARMKKVIDIDADARTVTVEPGITWRELDAALQKHGFALPVYPTSAPAATVGGWVAQGGTGIGSFRSGTIRDNVVAVELVTPTGEVQSISGEDLDLVVGLEGITGFITRVTLKIEPFQEDIPVLVAFDTPEDLEKAIARLSGGSDNDSLWSVTLFNPNFVRLKQAATGEKILPEDKYLCMLVARGRVPADLNAVVFESGGAVLNGELARHEWEERFYPLRLKRNGPSIIASEVIVPVDRLARFVGEAERKHKDIAFEGTVARGGQVTLLGLMLGDERKATFALEYSSSIALMDQAKKLGGHYYAAGMYFTDQAEDLFGRDTLEKVVEFKRQQDPHGIMNPGKILPPSMDPNSPIKMLAAAVKTARAGKSVLGSVGRLFAGKGEASGPATDLPAEIAREAFVCAQCGYCRWACTVFDSDPWEGNSPRGKWYLLKEYVKGNLPFDEKLAEALFFCTTCKKCDVVCQLGIDNAEHWLSLRPLLNAKKFENTGLAAVREHVLSTGNFWGVPAEQARRWVPDDIRYAQEGAVAYWPGCWASIVMQNM